MYIGLVDDDLREDYRYPNLEIMKLSSYYKKNKDIVELVRDYRQYERYSKIILRKNLISNNLPTLFLSRVRGKCEYGGYAFTNGIYVPMDDEIEKSLPDATIYDKINKGKVDFVTRIRKNPVRLQTNDRLTGINKQNRFLVYDKQAYYYPSYSELLKLAKTIEFVEPQYFDNFDDVIEFDAEDKILANTKIIYTNELTESMAAATKKIRLRVPIYCNMIPDKYSNCSTETGIGIILAYIDNIISIYKVTDKLIPNNIFTNEILRKVMSCIQQPDLDKLTAILNENKIKIQGKYITLIKKVECLWRYNQCQKG